MMRDGAQAEARHRLFDHYIGFARSLAWKAFQRRTQGDLEIEDLRQLASTGLIEAIDRFDSERGVDFRVYAGRRISGSISDGIARSSEMRQQQSARARMRKERVRALLPDQGGERLSSREALEALAELAMGLAIGMMLEDTDLYVDEDSSPPVRAPRPTAYDSAAWHELTRRLAREIDDLPEREATILRKHYLDSLDFETLARLLELSKGRISQLHRSALARLRKRLARHGHFSLER
jgi:RNA polymerase sigma factor for flagellar operon FliA